MQALAEKAIQLHTEKVGCLCCDANSGQRLFTEHYTLLGSAAELGINRCRRCGLVYVSPRLTPSTTRLVYEFDAEHTISHNYCWDGSVSERRFEPILDRLAKLAQPGKLLDVGCGGGHFLQAASRLGLWQLTGLEPIAAAADQAARYARCEVRKATLEDAHLPDNTFTVITMLGVLEHLHDPRYALLQAKRLLKADGMLGIYVPNFNYLRLKDTGPLSYVRHRRWSKLHPQEHLFQFQPRTLRQLLKSTGFETVQVNVGKPFMHGSQIKRLLKQVAYGAVNSLHALTGLHLGGLEVIAQVSSQVESKSGSTNPSSKLAG